MKLFHAAAFLLAIGAIAQFALAVPASFEKTDDGWQLLRDGKPYTIKGAGGHEYLDQLKAAGGNSIRTWGVGDDTAALLDECDSHGITVTLGLWINHRDDTHDYANPDYVKQARERLLAEAKDMATQYKDHPAVLMYAVGNESEIGNDTPAYWETLNLLAEAIKEIDPDRPVITVTAEMGGGEIPHGTMIARHAPALDAWGINSYGGLFTLRQRRDEAQQKGLEGMDGPFLVTEFGPIGQWETTKTPWGTPYEQTSTEKALQYRKLYHDQIETNPDCVGSYVFLWGQKQEATGTWFGMFLNDGRPTGTVDAMQNAWSGSWPDNLAPEIRSFESSITWEGITPGGEIRVAVDGVDPEGQPLTYEWSVREASEGANNQGRAEAETAAAEVDFKVDGGVVTFKVPEKAGPYRVFLVLTDGEKVATMNLPFHVGKP